MSLQVIGLRETPSNSWRDLGAILHFGLSLDFGLITVVRGNVGEGVRFWRRPQEKQVVSRLLKVDLVIGDFEWDFAELRRD